MSQVDGYTDVVELCALLQCLGFSVKSLEMNDGDFSRDTGSKTVVVNCESSGLRVVLENSSLSCSCPATNMQNSGFWQVSGVAGGKQLDKESGSTLLGSIPKMHRERFTKELREMVRCIKEYTEPDLDKSKDKEAINKSASMVNLKTPEDKQHVKLKVETPTRYRSLDTLTAGKDINPLPAPGPLQKHNLIDATADDPKIDVRSMCRRQSTYTLSSTPGSVRRRNKTSSPIQTPHNNVLEGLIAAEKAAEDLRCKLSLVIRDYVDSKNDSSMSSSVLDMSKISVLKATETSKAQFASSPNLSAVGSVQDVLTSRLKRFESASTSNLAPKPSPKKTSRLRRISPNFFKSKKENANDKIKGQENKTKINSLFKPRALTPGRSSKLNSEPSPNLSATKKKFSHIKSTIPRPTSKKE